MFLQAVLSSLRQMSCAVNFRLIVGVKTRLTTISLKSVTLQISRRVAEARALRVVN